MDSGQDQRVQFCLNGQYHEHKKLFNIPKKWFLVNSKRVSSEECYQSAYKMFEPLEGYSSNAKYRPNGVYRWETLNQKI